MPSTIKIFWVGTILCGFTSTIWEDMVRKARKSDGFSTIHPNWAKKLIASIIHLTTTIWNDQNKTLHGSSRMEAQQLLRSRILKQVHHIYQHPPILHSQFQAITKVPLDKRLLCSTTNLQRWLSRLSHQRKVSSLLKKRYKNNQLSLKQAYRRSNLVIPDDRKFPP